MPNGLTDRHRQHLEKSAIAPHIIEKRCYWSIQSSSYARVNAPPYRSQTNDDTPFTKALLEKHLGPNEGLVIPLYPRPGDTTQQVVRYQLRPDFPIEDSKGRKQKYVVTGKQQLRPDFLHGGDPQKPWDKSQPLAIVEGIKKADALASIKPDWSIVGILHCYGAVLDDKIFPEILDEAKGRETVYVCLDADMASNRKVRKAARDLEAVWPAEGHGQLQWIVIPPNGDTARGLDDFLADGGQWDDLAVRETVSGGKEYPKSAVALKAIFADMGIQARYDVRSHTIHFHGWKGQGWRETNDRMESALREKISEEYVSPPDRNGDCKPLKFSKDAWETCLNAILDENEVDAFIVDFLDKLPVHDGVWRLEYMLPDQFGAENSEIVQWAGKSPFIGAIQRAYEPGAKIDEMAVLIGGQGLGKSSFLRWALPTENVGLAWFSDGLDLSHSDKERAEALQGRVFVEAPELAGATRAELESLKAFLTRQDDGVVRFAFRRNPEIMKRRAMIMGTSNNDDCLPNDPTGNRRFVPILLKEGFNVQAYMAEHRDQLWAEAMVRYKRGERANLPRSLHVQAQQQAEDFRRRDATIEDAIDAIIVEPGDAMRVVDVARLVGLLGHDAKDAEFSKGDQMRLSAALKARGWERDTKARPVVWRKMQQWGANVQVKTA